MRTAWRMRAAAGVLVAMAATGSAARERAEPVISLRYRGGPGGAPQLNDLAAIRVVGFDTVAWPDAAATHLPELERIAEIVGLNVVVLPPPVHLASGRARTPGSHIDVRVTDDDARLLTPLVWRAVAHGARSIAFDGGAVGAGLTRADGTPAAWVAPVVALARQLSANRTLVDVMRPGPAIVIDAPRGADVDVVLLDGGRAWVIVATNLSASATTARVTFPKDVPSGLWASWLDDSAMSMLHQPAGPRWTVELDAFGTRVYFIDKNPRGGA